MGDNLYVSVAQTSPITSHQPSFPELLIDANILCHGEYLRPILIRVYNQRYVFLFNVVMYACYSI